MRAPPVRILRPFTGPNSYDFREEEGDLLFAAVGCFEERLELPAKLPFYASLLCALASEKHSVVVQAQVHWWDRASAKRQLRLLPVVAEAKEWIAVRPRSPNDLHAVVGHFWIRNALSFYAVPTEMQITERVLEEWYRLDLEEFGRKELGTLRFVAEVVWCEGHFLMLRSTRVEREEFLRAVSEIGAAHGLVFHHNRAPFADFFNGRSNRPSAGS